MSDVLHTYAAYAKDEKIRLNSSSGGIFSVLALRMLYLGGVVYGVKMTNDCYSAEFVRVDNEKDLVILRGSKYFQAVVGDSFFMVKKDLENGIRVLFSGTGCQINALKKFLGKDYDNLYCTDVICHGVPSPVLWKQYAHYMEKKNNAKLTSINFRAKDDGWTDFGMKEIDENHKEVYVSKDIDYFMQMFLRDHCLRPSCYECAAKKDKQSDITMADFWGINHVAPEMNDGKGTSLVITRTEKGQKLFDEVSENLIRKAVSYEDGIKGNPAEYKSVERPNTRDAFFIDMNQMEFGALARIYAGPRKISLKSRVKKLIKKLLIQMHILKSGGY